MTGTPSGYDSRLAARDSRLATSKRVTQRLELERQIDRLDHYIIGDGELHRREVQNGFDPESYQPIGHTLGHIGGDHQHRHIHRLTLQLLLQVRDVQHREPVPLPPDLGWIAVEDGHDVEAPLLESAVLNQRASDLPCPDHPHPVAPFESEYLTQPIRQLRDRVSQPPFAKRSKE